MMNPSLIVGLLLLAGLACGGVTRLPEGFSHVVHVRSEVPANVAD
jgi:hypothetical protein